LKRSGGDKRPYLSDLRESGAIEQDADKVIFLYRSNYYGLMEDENGMPTDGIAELIVAKNRSGILENIRIGIDSDFTCFKDLEESNRTSQILF
jgi:replicative DNA helicase